ncbi:MAG: chromosomal replication initiator protein DnaA, partial [Candidatus Margulisiibacteriota bacterium]
KTVKYLTAEKFVTEVVEAIGRRHMKSFKDEYRTVDCLLVDDVQFFARKETSQEEFFHTFNELYERNKQVIITSDRSPKELGGLDQRLTTRFGMGMVVELTAPEFETRVAILNQKCQEFETLIAPEVLNFIATNVCGSVRELEGILRQAVAEAELANRVPTIRSVAEIIKRLNKSHELIGIDIENKKTLLKARTALDVMNAVGRYYNLTLEVLTGSDRHKEVMMPRQICMYLIKHELGESYERIGQGFGGRNHTTVMHACNRTAEMLKKNVRMVRDINVIKHEMGM